MSRLVSSVTGGLVLALLGCGGGGDGGPKDVTVTGTVVGTVVVAYDDAGTRVAAATAAGSPPRKTFSLTLPTGRSYSLFLVENEDTASQRVYPLYADASLGANRFRLSEPGTLDLGFVDTTSGRALPAKNPLFANGVSSAGVSSSIPSDLAASGTVFSQGDLEGRWALQSLGVTPAGVSWTRAVLAVAADGLAEFTSLESSLPTGVQPPVTVTQTPGGVVLLAGSDFRGVMSSRKDVVVWTASFPGMGKVLGVLLRQSGALPASALVGSFRFHLLKGISAADPLPARGSWARGQLVVASDLSISVPASSFETSDPAHDSAAAFGGVLSVAADGSLSLSSNPTFRGSATPSGETVVATATDTAGEQILLVLQRGGTGFASPDLDGTWSLRQLEFWPGTLAEWAYGKASIAAGVATLLEVAPSPGPGDPIPVELSADGVVTLTGDPGFRGALSLDRCLLVGTTSVDSGATSQMVLLVK